MTISDLVFLWVIGSMVGLFALAFGWNWWYEHWRDDRHRVIGERVQAERAERWPWLDDLAPDDRGWLRDQLAIAGQQTTRLWDYLRPAPQPRPVDPNCAHENTVTASTITDPYLYRTCLDCGANLNPKENR